MPVENRVHLSLEFDRDLKRDEFLDTLGAHGRHKSNPDAGTLARSEAAGIAISAI